MIHLHTMNECEVLQRQASAGTGLITGFLSATVRVCECLQLVAVAVPCTPQGDFSLTPAGYGFFVIGARINAGFFSSSFEIFQKWIERLHCEILASGVFVTCKIVIVTSN